MQNIREQRIRQIIFEETRAVIDDHFVYANWAHGRTYINKKAIYLYEEKISELCEYQADDFLPYSIEGTIGPESGGIVMARLTAFHFSRILGKEIPFFSADKIGDPSDRIFAITPEDALRIKDRRMLVTEDILTTGTSARKVVELVRKAGGVVVGVAALCNRQNVTVADLGGNLVLGALLDLPLTIYDEAEPCPLCLEGIPINTEFGRGKEFLEKKRGISLNF